MSQSAQPAELIRLWRARCSLSGLEAVHRDVEMVLAPELRAVAGFRGLSFAMREIGDAYEILIETRWDSPAALRAFVGEDMEAAVVSSNLRHLLIDYEERVSLYQLVSDETA
ncbi:MAG: hypothetical protein JWR08_73 [Enterovirga sp.]|nr:hypothetical protein [Enterovirga sp.]